MKTFTIIKTGYTAGIYGCSNEYFVCIYSKGREMHNFLFHGMYGAEERVARAMKDKGFVDCYTPSWFGKMTRKDVCPGSLSETQAIDLVKYLNRRVVK